MTVQTVPPHAERWLKTHEARGVLGIRSETLRKWADAGPEKLRTRRTHANHREYLASDVYDLRDVMDAQAARR